MIGLKYAFILCDHVRQHLPRGFLRSRTRQRRCKVLARRESLRMCRSEGLALRSAHRFIDLSDIGTGVRIEQYVRKVISDGECPWMIFAEHIRVSRLSLAQHVLCFRE